MALSRLVATGQPATVQETSLSLDALGRFVGSTWDEAAGNGGPPFTAVVVGSGMYGGYCAAKLYRERPAARILVLEAGPFLVGEHVQNLGRVGRVGLGVPAPISPSTDPGVARDLVWGLPWRGNVEFPGLAYCVGGKSLFWGGWCPRLTGADLAQWPATTAAYLRDNYTFVESETGVRPAADFITGDLHQVLINRVRAVAGAMPGIDTTHGDGVEIAPLAVQGSPPESGLFGFDKFSSVPLLADAIREDVESSGFDDARRRLFLVPRAHVVRLDVKDGGVRSVEVDVAGKRHALLVQPGCMVVLAASAVESTRLALVSAPSPLMGRNLMAHVRSDFTVRIRRTALPQLPVNMNVQTGALLVRGAVPTGRFHLQVTSSTSRGGSDELLFRSIPDLDLLDAQRTNTDPNWVSITLRGIGEMRGDRTTPLHDPAKSWLDLSPYESDEFASRGRTCTLPSPRRTRPPGRRWTTPLWGSHG
jgi:hypothetical protein